MKNQASSYPDPASTHRALELALTFSALIRHVRLSQGVLKGTNTDINGTKEPFDASHFAFGKTLLTGVYLTFKDRQQNEILVRGRTELARQEARRASVEAEARARDAFTSAGELRQARGMLRGQLADVIGLRGRQMQTLYTMQASTELADRAETWARTLGYEGSEQLARSLAEAQRRDETAVAQIDAEAWASEMALSAELQADGARAWAARSAEAAATAELRALNASETRPVGENSGEYNLGDGKVDVHTIDWLNAWIFREAWINGREMDLLKVPFTAKALIGWEGTEGKGIDWSRMWAGGPLTLHFDVEEMPAQGSFAQGTIAVALRREEMTEPVCQSQ
jgi:hypothetical protein